VAAELPLQAIADLLGIPQEDRHQVFEWTNGMLVAESMEAASAVSAEMLGYAWQMAEDRMANPRGDIATTLVNAAVDGSALTEEEFSFFVLMLAVAGNETTRNAITHGMNAFFDNPDQWELYRAERPRTTADEIVRWATPVHAFQRTALEDTEVGGTEILKGQRVVMFYSSANHDSSVFTDPHRFDITRDPNPHLGFGGRGIHYCVGASLARMEIDLIFEAIATHLPAVRRTGPVQRMHLGWLNGVTEMPVAYS
jgi:cholest-4-en-3-one 26-monooxygenase